MRSPIPDYLRGVMATCAADASGAVAVYDAGDVERRRALR